MSCSCSLTHESWKPLLSQLACNKQTQNNWSLINEIMINEQCFFFYSGGLGVPHLVTSTPIWHLYPFFGPELPPPPPIWDLSPKIWKKEKTNKKQTNKHFLHQFWQYLGLKQVHVSLRTFILCFKKKTEISQYLSNRPPIKILSQRKN